MCRSTAFSLLALTLIQALYGCGGGNGDGQGFLAPEPAAPAPAEPEPAEPDPPAEPAPMSFSQGGHGHFIGEVTIADQKYFSEALLTVDGAVRIYIGGLGGEELHGASGPQEDLFHPQESILFVGDIDGIDQSSASGSGAVIGQICDGASVRFCDEPAAARVSLVSSSREHLRFLRGDLTIATPSEEQRWTVDLTSYSAYYASGAGDVGNYNGVFKERLAPFAQAEEMLIRIGPGGRVRFTSDVSGCAGDGTMVPHLNGQYNVLDVYLQIEGCMAPFEYLNSEFEGLATETQGNYWSYDTWLVVFLSAPDGPPPRPAVTMRSYLCAASSPEDSPEPDCPPS